MSPVAIKGRPIRALCVAGLVAFAASPAFAGGSNAPAPLDLSSYATAADFDAIAPHARLAGTFDLGTVSMNGFAAQSSDVSYPPVSLIDGVTLEFGAGTDFASRFTALNPIDTRTFDDLFLGSSALRGSYAGLAGGGTYIDTDIELDPGLHLSLGGQSLPEGLGADFSPERSVAALGGIGLAEDRREANSLLAGVRWDVAPWGGIGVTASQTSEQGGVLGEFDPSVRAADTSSVGISARLQLGGGWMTTASFAQAITKLDLKPGFANASDDWRSRSYGIAVAKRGLFGNDAMGVAVSHPAPGMGGTGFDLVSGIGARAQPLPEGLLLDGQSSETDFEVGYLTTFLDGSVALQTNASYQMNFAGQSGNNAVSFLSRAKIKF
ncbi:MAG: hypothetical protein JO261_06830 [Alphaproteobacteria bacterium]|nr:hypothetical protein [Alphaproteobacteria bacterium]MBV9693399.1 hypothetical protein [Alphaproteobacteria bacterium]